MNDRPLSLLDNLRFSNGPQELKNYFREQYQIDHNKAIELLNDQNLHFGTLYQLKSELDDKTIKSGLDKVYRKAIDIANLLSAQMQNRSARNPESLERKLRSRDDDTNSALRWIVGTGGLEDGFDSKYELLMERSAALLIKSHGDTTQLPALAEMIFARNRRKALIHELVWAFFEARSPDSLLLLAQRLNSRDSRDAMLAKKLLSFIPGIGDKSVHTSISPYSWVSGWLDENRPFLCYTGENLHVSNKPMPYSVSASAKYLCHPVSINTGEPLMPFLPSEIKKLSAFQKLPEKRQQQLAAFSWMLYRRNIYQWNSWIRLSVNEQSALASQMMGGYQ